MLEGKCRGCETRRRGFGPVAGNERQGCSHGTQAGTGVIEVMVRAILLNVGCRAVSALQSML